MSYRSCILLCAPAVVSIVPPCSADSNRFSTQELQVFSDSSRVSTQELQILHFTLFPSGGEYSVTLFC